MNIKPNFKATFLNKKVLIQTAVNNNCYYQEIENYFQFQKLEKFPQKYLCYK